MLQNAAVSLMTSETGHDTRQVWSSSCAVFLSSSLPLECPLILSTSWVSSGASSSALSPSGSLTRRSILSFARANRTFSRTAPSWKRCRLPLLAQEARSSCRSLVEGSFASSQRGPLDGALGVPDCSTPTSSCATKLPLRPLQPGARQRTGGG